MRSRLTLILAGIGLCATAHVALASLPPQEIQCSRSAKVAAWRAMPANSREKALRKLLLESATPQCIGSQLFGKGGSAAGLPVLVKLLASDSSADVRARAADALGRVVAGRKAALAALSAGLGDEDNAQVVLARIGSMGQQLALIGTPGWDRSIDMAETFEPLKSINNNPVRTAEETEILRFAVGRLVGNVGTKLTWTQDRHFSQEEISATWNQLIGQLDELMKREPGVKERTYDDWRDTPLFVLANVLESGTVGLDQGFNAAGLMKSAAAGMADPYPKVHMGSLKLMSAVQELIVHRMDPQWHDFAPYLSKKDAALMVKVAVAALPDEEPLVRAEAVRLLGLLTLTGRAHEGALVNALRDGSPDVRKQAAQALARRAVLPAEAVPLLIGLARQQSSDSPSAIAALSHDHSQAALEALVDVMGETTLPEAEPDEESALRKVRSAAAVRAIEKYGATAVLPVLRKTSLPGHSSLHSSLYEILQNVGWTSEARQPSVEVEAALKPALAGEDERARMFALALLAKQPLDAGHHYAAPLVEDLLARSLKDVAPESSGDAPNPWGESGYLEPWRMSPEDAAITLAGASPSAGAAKQMVSWLCSGNRQDDEKTRQTASSIVGSLKQMGPLARPLIATALAEEGVTAICQRNLGDL